METDTVFQSPINTNTPVQNQIPTPSAQSETIANQISPSSVPPPSPFSSFPLWTIIKIVIGLFVVGIVLFIIFRFIIPAFSKPSQEEVTLTYWGLWEDKAVFEKVLADFEKENPKIKVDYIQQDKKQYREKLLTRIQNGTGPDVFRFHNTWVSQLSRVLSPLSVDVISPDQFRKVYYPVMQKDLIKNGGIYGIPLEIDTLSLYVNTDIFKNAGAKVPTDWNDFVNISRGLTVKDKDTDNIKTSGAALGTFDNITHAPDIISMLFLQSGVNLVNPLETTKNTAGVFNFYTQFATSQDNVWDSSLDPSVIAFSKGNLAMYFGYSWDIFTIKSLNKDLNFEVYPVPYLPPNRGMTVASYWAEGVSVKSKHQKESMKLMQFLSRKETEEKLFAEQSKTRMFGEPYARKDLKDLLKDNKLLYPFVEQAENAGSSFFISDTYDNGINDRANVYLGNAIRSMLGNTSAETAIKDMSAGIYQIVKDYGL